MKSQLFWIAVPVVLALEGGALAQSLADVARAEEARRKTVKSGARVYTNDDLARTPAPSEPSSAPPTASAGASKPGDAAAKPEEQKPVDPAKTEKYWKDRSAAIQQSLSRSKLLLDALQSQVSGMQAEILSTDDPGKRALLEERFQRAGGERQRVQQDIEKQTKAAVDLQEEARKAGIPAGWLR